MGTGCMEAKAWAETEFGRVKLHGEELRATAACEILAGSTVRVVAVEGTHLVVESAKEGSC